MIGDFLSRWSRRKQAAAKTADPAKSPPAAESSAAGERGLMRDGAANFSPPPCGEGVGVGVARCGTPVPHGTTPHPTPPPQGGRESAGAPPQLNFAPVTPDPGVPAFDPASLPPIESITAETDIRAFIAAGVPAELTRAALRRVWTSDPKIRDFVGLADYDWDFNAPGAMAGFGPLEGADALRAQQAHRLGPVEDSAAERSDHAPVAEPAAPKSEACAHDRPEPPTPIKTDASHLPDQSARPDRDDAAAQQQEEKPEEAPSTARHKHGRALPE
jgi:hypothetical protein